MYVKKIDLAVNDVEIDDTTGFLNWLQLLRIMFNYRR